MTAYVLLNGSYSDEHIVAVFSSMELASAAAQIFTDEAHIDEFEIDACAEDMRQKWRVLVRRSGGRQQKPLHAVLGQRRQARDQDCVRPTRGVSGKGAAMKLLPSAYGWWMYSCGIAIGWVLRRMLS